MIAAIYARKSTAQDDVADEAKSVTRQVEGARAFITAKGWTLDDAHIYIDDGVSGALFANRAEFQRMMRDAAARRVRRRRVLRPGSLRSSRAPDDGRAQRAGRSRRHRLGLFAPAARSISTRFEGETTTLLRREFAQQYRDHIRKNDARSDALQGGAGLRHRRQGVRLRQPPDQKGHAERRINEAEAAIVRDIYARFADGEGARSIAAALNRGGVPSPRAQQGRPSGWSASTDPRRARRGRSIAARSSTAGRRKPTAANSASANRAREGHDRRAPRTVAAP